MEKTQPTLTFHHCPWSRSSGMRWLLEELGVDYAVHFVNIHAPTGAPESYRSIQPHKKVPAIEHGSLLITERAAIIIYLADTFPQAGLAPKLTDLALVLQRPANVRADELDQQLIFEHPEVMQQFGVAMEQQGFAESAAS